MEIETDVVLQPIESIIPYGNNAKEHPPEQVDKIASSIKNYGWDQPIVVDGDKEIIKGHGRLQAAKKLGLEQVPVITRADLTPAEAKASRIADNKTAESEWDDDLLGVELEQLMDDFEPIELGYDEGEIEDLLESVAEDNDATGLETEPLSDKALEDIKILNLYAGIGGNRKLWGDKPQITSVEYNDTIAKAYADFYPDDEVIVDDAHEYLLNNFDQFDFIWTSPPCPTHSKLRKNLSMETGAEPVFPDLKLYEEILLLQGYFDGKWVVENVDPWYDPLIEPQASGRHMFWSNFEIPNLDKAGTIGRDGESIMDSFDEKALATEFGYDFAQLKEYNFPSDYPRDKIIRNMVHPEVGKSILESALESEDMA